MPTDVYAVIRDSGAIPVAGLNYTLTCDVVGASATSYEWRKDGTLLSETGPTLTFSPLLFANAGRYTCEATVGTTQYRSNHNDIVIQS